MVSVDEINRAFSEDGNIMPEHKIKFLRTVGQHMVEVAPDYGNITFNFANGKCVGGNINESFQAEKKRVKV